MISIDCLQIIKFDESYYPINCFVRLIKVGHFICINGLGRPKSNSKNKSVQKARRKLGQFKTTFSGSFLVNLHSEEPTRIVHAFTFSWPFAIPSTEV